MSDMVLCLNAYSSSTSSRPFQMLPDLSAELTKGDEDIYVGWSFKK